MSKRVPSAKKRRMIALQHAAFGEPADVVKPVDLPVPEPGVGEVRLRMVRSPIHNHDLATIRGVYGYKPTLPAVAGTEVLGIVDALGEKVSGVEAGSRVATTTHGAWAEYVTANAAALVPMPEAIDDDRACQLIAMPMSTVVLFEDLRVNPGDWIVQNAANGAVGTMLMRLAQSHGVNVVNLVRREGAAGDLRKLGAKHVVVTEKEGWRDEVRAMTGASPIVRAIDSIAGPQSLEMQRLLGRGGELIIFGGLGGSAIKLDPSLMISNELIVRGFWMSAWMQRATQEQRIAITARVFELALNGELPLSVEGVYPLSEAAEALRVAEKPGRHGKVLFRP